MISSIKNFPSNTRVCVLIDDVNGSWIEDRVVKEFLPHEARSILSISLSSTHAKDSFIWTGTKNGCYSTKSAYRLLSYEAAASAPGPSNPSAHKKFWLDIWSLNVPSKIHHFIWRACNDSLPTKLNLQKRHITQDSICERCCCETEDIIHAMWGSQMVKSIWWEVEKCRPFLVDRFDSFRDLFHGILLQKQPRLAELFDYIAWSIWYNSKAQRTGSLAIPLTQIYSDAV